jgi:hypothetical protein
VAAKTVMPERQALRNTRPAWIRFPGHKSARADRAGAAAFQMDITVILQSPDLLDK